MNSSPSSQPTHASTDLAHEEVVIRRGARSGLTIVVAVHSTRLGPALGGCRLWHYPDWRDGLHDALRLSEGMSYKNAVADLDFGGGKAVIVAPADPLTTERREQAFADLGDAIQSLNGRYVTAEDVGTSAADMQIVATRTPHVVGLPTADGGHGDPGEFTARGVYACIKAVLPHIGRDGLRGTRLVVAGLGQVGTRLARTFIEEGGEVIVSDVNPAKRAEAEHLGAQWLAPFEAHTQKCDVFVPSGVGGMLSDQVIDELECSAVVGPANNQLQSRSGARRLADRGIFYAPDYIVNAGGVIFLANPAPDGPPTTALSKIDGLGERLEQILTQARLHDVTPADAADLLAARRLGCAPAIFAAENTVSTRG